MLAYYIERTDEESFAKSATTMFRHTFTKFAKAATVSVAAATALTFLAFEGPGQQLIFADGPNDRKKLKSQFSVPRYLKEEADKPKHAIDPVYAHGTPKPHPYAAYRYASDLSEAIDAHNHFDSTNYPVEKAVLTAAPNVPPPITR